MNFTRAIVRRPGQSMTRGISTANLGLPDYDLAVTQHQAYATALTRLGVSVTVLPADESFPDSTFVEDTALLTPKCAIIMRPGAESRRGETVAIEPTVRGFFPSIHHITAPGTADAGDIMCVGRHYFIGLSDRTTTDGAQQIIAILQSHGLSGSVIEVAAGLHLKSGMSYLEHGNILVTHAFAAHDDLKRMNHIVVDDDERYAANSLWVNDTVLVPSGYPKTLAAIRARGYQTVALDTSEFRKLDGGLSCLSLRF